MIEYQLNIDTIYFYSTEEFLSIDSEDYFNYYDKKSDGKYLMVEYVILSAIRHYLVPK
jgi:hypothetical protein